MLIIKNDTPYVLVIAHHESRSKILHPGIPSMTKILPGGSVEVFEGIRDRLIITSIRGTVVINSKMDCRTFDFGNKKLNAKVIPADRPVQADTVRIFEADS